VKLLSTCTYKLATLSELFTVESLPMHSQGSYKATAQQANMVQPMAPVCAKVLLMQV
jgi:hypothetical protein